jgi:ABC-type multidrug transport system fused ATPase/permease subunit
MNKISNTYNKIWTILGRKQKREVLILFVIVIIGTFLETISIGLIIPVLGVLMGDSSEIFNKYAKSISFIKTKEYLQIFLVSLLIGLYIIKGLFLAFQAWFQTKFSFGLTAEISNRLFKGYIMQEYDYHLERKSSDLLRNITTEVGTFSSVLQAAIVILSEMSIVASIVILLFFVNPMASIVSFITLSILAFSFSMIAKKYNLKWGSQRHEFDSLKLSIILQAFDGIKEIKHYCRESFFLSRYIECNNKVINPSEKQYTLQLLPRIFFEVIAVMLCLGYVLINLIFYKNVNMVIPQIGVLVAASFRLMPSFNRIISSMQTFRFADIVINNISSEFNELKLIQSQAKDNEKLLPSITFKKEIKISNVDFSYKEGKKVLGDVSLNIQRNQFVAFVGKSGEGKSTMIDLILGLLKPNSGEILVDGNNITERLTSWRKIIGYVPQTFYLFDDTIKNNIIFSTTDECDINKLKLTIDRAQLGTYISDLPSGIDTFVGEKGSNLSGGQRQRLAIARALYFSPQILILDEPTSALDSEMANEIMTTLDELRKEINITIILITHNTANLKACDKIFEISHGNINEIKNLL